MEFHEKLQELRKQRGLTQEELAKVLFVSRAAVSKWESGRGYPNIESLKTIAKFYDVTLDDLLSGDEILSVAEEDSKEKQANYRDLVFGLLDCGGAMLFVLPFFGQKAEDMVRAVSLLFLTGIAPYLRFAYFAAVIGMIATGILMLTLQNCRQESWLRAKIWLSLGFNGTGALLFIIGQQPYGAVFLFAVLIIKGIILAKKQ